MGKVLVTGATGFVGNSLLQYLGESGYDVLGSVRSKQSAARCVFVPEISSTTNWKSALLGRDCVVHTAARAHVLKETAADPLAAFRAINTEGTLNLARQAALAGVRRFVFLSSIGVVGQLTQSGTRFNEHTRPAPHSPYAVSKFEAELGLSAIAKETGMELVILRPPLVYGPNVKANFLRLIQLVRSGFPLPFGAIENRRSLLYIGNLTNAIRLCIEHPLAPGQVFLVDDGKPVSTPDLVRELASAMGRRPRLFSVPVNLLKWMGQVTGKRSAVTQLTGSLWIDGSAIRKRLGWRPPFSLQEGLVATVAKGNYAGESPQSDRIPRDRNIH